MSYDQVAIYKYGRHAQAVNLAQANSSLVVARQFIPNSRTVQLYRPMTSSPSSMSGSYENDNARWTQEQIRDYKERRLRTKKADALADFFGISRDVDQEEWEEQQTNLQNYGAGPSKSHETSSRQNSGDVHFKSAQVHNPTTNEVTEVTVIEDSACQLNFISREVAELCHLTIYPTARVENATLMGSFHSDQWTEVSWLGKNGNNGFDQFYIAPDGAPIQLLVGTRFMSDNPDVFMSQTLAKPAFLNVQKKIKKDEQPLIQANEASANAQAAELDNKRKRTGHQQGQQKQKQTGSSSRSSRHK